MGKLKPRRTWEGSKLSFCLSKVRSFFGCLSLQVDGEEPVASGGDDEGDEAEPDARDGQHVHHGDLLLLAAVCRVYCR